MAKRQRADLGQEDRVYQALRHDVLGGVYPLDKRLPGVPTMAKTFGVSYGTAHSAMRRLQDERLVSVQRGRGTFPTPSRVVGIDILWFCRTTDVPTDPIYQELQATVDSLGDFPEFRVSLRPFDVRSLPRPADLAQDCRRRGVQGLLVVGHGVHHLDFVDELSDRINIISLFGHWPDSRCSYVAPDTAAAIDEVLGRWHDSGQARVGFLASNLEHPNYLAAQRAVVDHAAARSIDFDMGEDRFIGGYRDTLKWLIGRFVLAEPPLCWVAAIQDRASLVHQAAAAANFPGHAEIQVLTFAGSSQARAHLAAAITLGVYRLPHMLARGLAVMRGMVWADDSATANPRANLVPYELL